MIFTPPLQPARLIKRYQRFLADVQTPDDRVITLHCANTGAMTGCATPGHTVWYSTSDDPKRKYAHSWELTETPADQWICVNTLQANRLLREAVNAGNIAELSGYKKMRSEVRYGTENSRIDLLLQKEKRADCYIEVKSVTLLHSSCGYFPDAVTVRGQKHLRELQRQAENGKRAILFFAVLHTGIQRVLPACHIDPQYAQLLIQAQSQGVEVICYRATINAEGMVLKTMIPFGLTL